MEGWIKIHRKLLDWEWYQDINTKTVFLHILLKSNFEEKKWQGMLIKRGQLITSISNLAKDLKLTEQNVRTSLKKLENTRRNNNQINKQIYSDKH